MSKRIFIVEDEESIADLEKDYLELSGFDVEVANDGRTGLSRAMNEDYDLIILDLMLPGVDGFEICRQVRDSKNTPIIMVSAKKDDIDKIRGLGMGADDYMTKPFGVREFSARINALVRRSGAEDKTEPEDENVLNVGDVYLNVDSREVVSSGEFLELTYMEFELLRYFMLNKGIVLSREKLAEEVWGFDYEGETRTIDMHVKSLRSKLGANKELIKTVRYIGYKMEKDRWKPQI